MPNFEEKEIIGDSDSSGSTLEERRIHFQLRIGGQAAEESYTSYSVFQDGGRYEKAYSNFSKEKADANNHMMVVTLLEFPEISEACYYCDLAREFSCSKHILHVCFCFPDLAKDPPVVLVAEIKGFYDEWCERELDFFQKCKNAYDARKTLNMFITIIRGVVKGLICLFKEKKYHGNLSDGIAIDDDLNASLYNMRQIGCEAFEDGITEDMEELHDMISIWLSREDEFVESRSLRRFQETLENKAVLMKDCNYIWLLNDTMFWSLSKKQKFMDALYFFIYGRRTWPKTLENSFCFDWQSLIPEQENDPFRIMYYRRIPEYETEARYTKNIDLVKFCFRARASYSKYACQYFTQNDVQAKMEELFNVTEVCFSAVVSYLLGDSTSEKDVLFKTEMKAATNIFKN